MSQIKLGNHEVIKKNYDYLLLAKQNGFFQNGYDSEDIASCDDWVVVWWIDELGNKKQDEEKFKNEMLTSFKRWFSNGLNSTGVGRYYDLLRSAELYGLKIDKGLFDCITWLDLKKKEKDLTQESILNVPKTYEEIVKHFENEELLKSLSTWKKQGTPLLGETGEFYDTFKEIEQHGEIIDFEKFIFFYTLKNKINQRLNLVEAWYDKKDLEEEYGIKIISGDEFERLQGWNDGYNYNAIDDLEKRISHAKKHLPKETGISIFSKKLSRYVNKDISISYSELTDLGEEQIRNIKGKLVANNDNSITILFNNQSGKEETMTLKDDDNTFIKKIGLIGYGQIYESRTARERINIRRNELKIDKIKSEDLVSKYIEKFGSIKGLAYLKNRALDFIETIDSEVFPINNLFTFCYEAIGSRRKEDIQKVLYIYNMVRSGQLEFLKNGNNGYPIEDFLSEYTQEKLIQYCYYIYSTIKNEDLPPLPSATSNKQSENTDNVTRIPFQNKGQIFEEEVEIDTEDLSLEGGRRR